MNRAPHPLDYRCPTCDARPGEQCVALPIGQPDSICEPTIDTDGNYTTRHPARLARSNTAAAAELGTHHTPTAAERAATAQLRATIAATLRRETPPCDQHSSSPSASSPSSSASSCSPAT